MRRGRRLGADLLTLHPPCCSPRAKVTEPTSAGYISPSTCASGNISPGCHMSAVDARCPRRPAIPRLHKRQVMEAHAPSGRKGRNRGFIHIFIVDRNETASPIQKNVLVVSVKITNLDFRPEFPGREQTGCPQRKHRASAATAEVRRKIRQARPDQSFLDC